jgi:alkanesulfonate monooxygenase SsuD/methylene tetrahydromethanopterin reductase-like flavin-dependent oxidoreductase (luciferase family)
LFFGGASAGVERIASFRTQAATFGRTPGFNVSLRPIIAAREGDAWDHASTYLVRFTPDSHRQRRHPESSISRLGSIT